MILIILGSSLWCWETSLKGDSVGNLFVDKYTWYWVCVLCIGVFELENDLHNIDIHFLKNI